MRVVVASGIRAALVEGGAIVGLRGGLDGSFRGIRLSCSAVSGEGVKLHELTIPVDEATSVSALVSIPADPFAIYVLAHGAGAGMTHPFLAEVAAGFAMRRIATLRYQFPYMERGSKRPDRPGLAQATVRAAVLQANALFPSTTMFAGGKSFGGRMTSQAQSAMPLPSVRGLAFIGFPLHTPDAPSDQRAEHLAKVEIPMLFAQGTRDKLADFALLRQVVAKLGRDAALFAIDEADHSFHVPVRSGRTDTEVMSELLDGMAEWMRSLADTREG
jgi:uncharacterized protein